MEQHSLSLYKKWAPDNSIWAAWAKPVLFASLSLVLKMPEKIEMEIPDVTVPFKSSTMIIVDLPDKQSVAEALAYAAKGWMPVPLYNGVIGEGIMLVDVNDLGKALKEGAKILDTLSIPPNAPPVFMLDSRRMSCSRVPEVFDNRWSIFPQDMPSASFLNKHGIEKVIVRAANNIEDDLERVLLEYQKSKIMLYSLLDKTDSPKKITARKRSPVERATYRLSVTMGLKRNSTGGFGGVIPVPLEDRELGREFYTHGRYS